MQNPQKPYHLMTPAERTAARIAQNRAIDAKAEKVRAARQQAQDAANRNTERELDILARQFNDPVFDELVARYRANDPGYRPCRCEDYPCCGH